MSRETEWTEVGRDPFDRPRAAAPPRRAWLPRPRPALGVPSAVAPPVMFIVLGLLLGPHALDVISPAVLNRLDIVVSVALAILGVFVGLGTTSIPAGAMRTSLAGGIIGSAVTIAAVGVGLALLVASWGLRLPLHPLGYAAFIGICASASASMYFTETPVTVRAAYLADVDDIPLVVLGTGAIAVLAGGSPSSILLRLGTTLLAAAAVGVAGWLLFDRARGPAERAVFVTGAVLLLAGIGAYLGTSPLLTGAVAALVWVRAPGAADRITAADLRILQHPLVSLLLIVAGALIEWSLFVLWVAAAIVLLRLMGKLIASFALAPMLRIEPGVLASALLPPGVMGIALALNARQVLGGELTSLVAAVTAATAASEILAVFLPRELEKAA